MARISAVTEVLRAAAENPRRVVHSLKVGLALALTSLTVLQDDLFEWLGANAIWAVMTVVVVFELTAGATICKGLNRALGTLFAGGLALGVECLADLAGPIGEKYVVVMFVFLTGTLTTYARFCEPFKSKYDYGVLIFLLTFSLILISSYRVTNNVELAISRLLNIILGGVICLVITLLIQPVWASEDLHNIITTNFENLAQALEGFENAYFKEELYQQVVREDDPIYKCYKAVLVSKSSEESLAKFASWEPRWKTINGSKGLWKQYVQVGGMLRNCTYVVVSLHGCLVSNVQGVYASPKDVSSACQNLTRECIALIKELGKSLRQKERSKVKEDLVRLLLQRVESLKHVTGHLNEMLLASSSPNNNLSPMNDVEGNTVANNLSQDQNNMCDVRKELPIGTLAIATITLLLFELVSQLMHLLDAQKVLENLSKFKEPKPRLENTTTSTKSNSFVESLTIQSIE